MSWLVFAGIVLTFLTAVLGLVSSRRNRRKIDEVHVLVDGNFSKLLARWGIQEERSGQLEGSLRDAGVEVPPKPPSSG